MTEDEAGILRDFFRVQSDKHGPELLSRLNNIEYGEGRGAGGKVKMEEVVEEVIQQELQAESLALRNSSPGSECSSEGPGPCLPEHVALAFGSPGPRAVGPWLLGHGGLLLSLPLQEQAALGELLRLHQGGGNEGPPAQRGVSVIQRAPPRGPRHFLEKREQKRAGMVGLTPLHLLKRKAGEQESREEGPAKRRSNQQQSDHLICEMCGDRAGKHSYYCGQVSHRTVSQATCARYFVTPSPCCVVTVPVPPRSVPPAGPFSGAPSRVAIMRPSSARRAPRTARSP